MKAIQSGQIRMKKAQRGLTLVELMVSIAIGLVLLTGLIAMFSSMTSSRNELDKSSRQIENGRYAVQILGDEIRNAGYFGPLLNAPTAPGAIPDPCAQLDADANAGLGIPLQGYTGSSTVGGLGLSCMTSSTNYKPNTAVLVVRRAGTTSAYSSSEFNIQVSGCAGDTAPYKMSASSAPLTLHKNLAGTGCTLLSAAADADIYPMYVRIFYVSSCSTLTSSGACNDSIPTLKRMDVKPGSLTVTPLVEGIEDIKYDYGIDNVAGTVDSVPDSYVTPTSTALTLAQLSDIVTVRVNVLARNLEPTQSYVDSKSYALSPAAAASAYAPNDAFKRHVFSELVRLNNPAGRRE